MTTTSTHQPAPIAGVPHPAGSLQIQFTFGAVCRQSQEVAEFMCQHGSCCMIAEERAHYGDPACPDNEDREAGDLFFCPVHWTWASVDETRSFSGTGFAGGAIYHVWYTCGCQDHDESADVAAAV